MANRQRNRFVCFGNPFKISKLPTVSSPASTNKRFILDVCNSPATESMVDFSVADQVGLTPTREKESFSKRRHRQRHVNRQHYELDSDSSSGQLPRWRSWSICLGFLPSSKQYDRRKHHQSGSPYTKSKTRLTMSDESITDIPDSNRTTRSAATDSSHSNDDTVIPRRNSRCSSFYSVISSDETDWYSVQSSYTTRSRCPSSISKSRRCNSSEISIDDKLSSLENLDNKVVDEAPPAASVTRLDDSCLTEGSTTAPPSSRSLCACGFDFHNSMYNPDFPLTTGPGISPNSHEECVAVSKACLGCWETILERSQSLDSQYRCIGLGMVKRAVMNRLAIPLTMFLEDNDSILHCWIHTPLGIRHMRSNLCHQESVDDDPDAGTWTGVTQVVDFSIPWYCNGKPVRALQQRRQSPRVGTAIETRCILPDQAEGKIMLFQFVMIPKGKTDKDQLKADRILKYTGPKID